MKLNKQYFMIFILSLILGGCGVNKLPEMRTKAKDPFKEMMIQYRLRADVALMMAKWAEKDFPDAAQALKESRSKALSIELGLDAYSERQANRFQSFQNFVSRDMSQLIRQVEGQGKAQDPEFQSLKGQFQRLDHKLVLMKREYLTLARDFNEQTKKFPHSLYNKWKHNLQPLPEIGVLAQKTGN